jgi:hypothetical protein
MSFIIFFIIFLFLFVFAVTDWYYAKNELNQPKTDGKSTNISKEKLQIGSLNSSKKSKRAILARSLIITLILILVFVIFGVMSLAGFFAGPRYQEPSPIEYNASPLKK